ncbi:phage large subunit terminase [Ahrensia sp. R2A130]|nr:phage large subunit terminase [Ahrensia sp. R2A130]
MGQCSWRSSIQPSFKTYPTRSCPPLNVPLTQSAFRSAIQAEKQRRQRQAEFDDAVQNDGASLASFVKAAWHVVEPGTPLKWGWAMDAICEHLEAVTRGEILRLLTNVPPGMSKSLLHGVFWPAWEWGPQGLAHHRFLGTSHSGPLAVRDNLKCKRLIESEWYSERWNVRLTGDQRAKTKFENTATGFREAMPFTSLTGSRGHRVIVDDPLSVDDAGSDTVRASVNSTFRESVTTRLNDPETSAIVVIMQRLHENDVSGMILAKDFGYEHLMLPMEFEPERRCTTSIGFTDPRTENGELLFPERFPCEVVERDKSTMGSYSVAGQFQQRPAPRDGGMFKREWFKIVRAAPAGTVWIRGWDLAASTGEKSAYTAGVKIGRAPDGRFYIADSTRGQLSANGAEMLITGTATQDGTDVRISIPQDPGQAGKMQAQYYVRQLAGFNVRTSPEGPKKEARAEPLSAQAEAGNVMLIEGQWNEEFLDEMCNFPNGTFKDQVDAATRAFNELLAPVSSGPSFGRYGYG